MQFITGFKFIVLVSSILGSVLLTTCGLSLHQLLQRKLTPGNHTLALDKKQSSSTEKTSGYHHPESIERKEPLFIDTDKKVDIFTESIRKLKSKWTDFKPLLLGSSAVGLLCGIVQVLTNSYILCSNSREIRSRSKCWQCTHIIICGILMACIFVPAIFNMQNESLKKELLDQIGASVKAKEYFDNFQVPLVEVYITALDIVGIVILIITTCLISRYAEYDYRAT